jgi:hypothetical protein
MSRFALRCLWQPRLGSPPRLVLQPLANGLIEQLHGRRNQVAAGPETPGRMPALPGNAPLSQVADGPARGVLRPHFHDDSDVVWHDSSTNDRPCAFGGFPVEALQQRLANVIDQYRRPLACGPGQAVDHLMEDALIPLEGLPDAPPQATHARGCIDDTDGARLIGSLLDVSLALESQEVATHGVDVRQAHGAGDLAQRGRKPAPCEEAAHARERLVLLYGEYLSRHGEDVASERLNSTEADVTRRQAPVKGLLPPRAPLGGFRAPLTL